MFIPHVQDPDSPAAAGNLWSGHGRQPAKDQSAAVSTDPAWLGIWQAAVQQLATQHAAPEPITAARSAGPTVALALISAETAEDTVSPAAMEPESLWLPQPPAPAAAQPLPPPAQAAAQPLPPPAPAAAQPLPPATAQPTPALAQAAVQQTAPAEAVALPVASADLQPLRPLVRSPQPTAAQPTAAQPTAAGTAAKQFVGGALVQLPQGPAPAEPTPQPNPLAAPSAAIDPDAAPVPARIRELPQRPEALRPAATPPPGAAGPVPAQSEAPLMVEPAAATGGEGETAEPQYTRPAEAVIKVLRHLKTDEGPVKTVRLQLQPETLGKVTVRLELNEGQLRADLVVDSAAARQALEAGLSELRQRLMDQGIQLGSFHVSVGDDGSSARDEAERQSRQPDRSVTHPAGGNRPGRPAAGATAPYPGRVPGGRLDFRA